MSHFIEFQQKQIHYKVEGKGKTIVFLHGFLENLHIWDSIAESLSKDFQIVRIDLPGHGESENLAEVHSMEMMADCVFDLMKLLNISDCVLVGHSMGGYVAMAFARKYSFFLKGLVLFHSHAAADSLQGKINRSRTIEIIQKNHKDFMTYFIPELFAEENREIFSHEISILQKSSRNMTKLSIIASLEGMKHRPDSLDILENITCPILFIIGKKDSRIPWEMMQKQVYLPKISELLLLEGVAHMGFIEAKKICLKSIKAFVQKAFLY